MNIHYFPNAPRTNISCMFSELLQFCTLDSTVIAHSSDITVKVNNETSVCTVSAASTNGSQVVALLSELRSVCANPDRNFLQVNAQ